MTATPEPNGCAHCGTAQRGHFQRWRDNIGWHLWAAPTQEQIKERMLARQEATPTTPKAGA